MSDKQQAPLSEGEEILLMKFFDRECNFLDRARAQKLIDTHPPAAEFFNGLEQAAKAAQAYAAQSRKVDLWSNVSRRIESEEHAALFLGKRDTHETLSFRQRISSMFTNSWGLGVSGAAIAGLAFLIFLPTKTGVDTGDQMVEMARSGSYESPSVRPVAHERPRILNDQLPNVVEVDWMRSDGRLRMLQDPSERSAIIWVKRRSQAQARQNRRVGPSIVEQATPYIGVSAK